jgi:FMN phosphatase YigB (HAD superfamily)
MPSNNHIAFVFFDIGGTLGDRDPHTGKLVPFASTAKLMADIRDLMGLPMGVITTLGTLTNQDGMALLQDAGLAAFLAPNGFISEHDVQEKGKPRPAIYKFAANKVGIPVEKCLFIGENLTEVIGALAAGMQAILKPSPPGRELPV